MKKYRKGRVAVLSIALILATLGSVAQFSAKAQEEKKYTFKICAINEKEVGQFGKHAFVVISDGTVSGTKFSGFHPAVPADKPWRLALLLFGRIEAAAIHEEPGYKDTQSSEIEWNITADQYATLLAYIDGLKQQIEAGTLRYGLYGSWGSLSCMSYAIELAHAIGINPPDCIRRGRVPYVFGVPDVSAFDNELWELWLHGGWEGATIRYFPHSLEPGYLDPLSSIDGAVNEGIWDPNKLADLFSITLDMENLPPKAGKTGQTLSYNNPVPSIDPNGSFVFWDFGDTYTGVVGSPLDPSNNQQASYSFDKPGTYQGTLLVITETTLYHFTFTTGVTGGTGEPNNPYQIATKADLLAMAANTANYDKCFTLMADIDMQGQVFTTAIIGAATFTGTFDGNDHRITNFTINGDDYLGLFGYIGSGGSVKNLSLENCSVSGSQDVGGLAGENDGSISNCYSTGAVAVISGDFSQCLGGLVGGNVGSISNCYSTGSVSGFWYVGGLVGYNNGSINNCYSTGAATGSEYTSPYDGGTYGSESTGGLVGENWGSISNCYSTGAVSGSSDSYYVGGLVGYNWGSGVASGSFWDTWTSGQTTSDGGTGKTTAQMKTLSTFTSAGWDFLTIWNIVEGQTYPFFRETNLLTITATSGGTTNPVPGTHTYSLGSSVSVNAIPDANYSFDHWELDGSNVGSANPYSVLMNGNHTLHAVFVQTKYSGGTGTADDPYQIAIAADLLALAANTADYGKCFILTADIDMEGQVFTTAIIAVDTVAGRSFEGTAFTGTFDGNGHKITNFTINGGSNWYLGLFGYIGSGGSVKNLGLEDFAVSGSECIGGLVGYNGYNYDGTIVNCYSTGTVTGRDYLGGLVGYNLGGSISNCYSTGEVSGSWFVGGLVGQTWGGSISHCYSTSAISGSLYVGGLVGSNYGNISDCYSTGVVTGGHNSADLGGLVGINHYDCSISNCYSTGAVTGGSGSQDLGGLVGYNDYYGSISSSFWDTQTSGQTTSAGGTGKTTAEMKTKSTFTDAGWNLLIWDIVEGQTYPFFKSGGGTGTPDDPYRIATAEDLLALASATTDYDKCFILTADIDMEGQVFTTAIIASGDVFTGTFDGNGHKITNFTINGGSNSCLGLFGYISSGGSVKNLGLEDFAVSGSSDSYCVGGMVGVNEGIISNCYSTGAVSGGDYSYYLGGLVGWNSSSISNCYSTGAVNGTSDVGGLVGYNYGSVVGSFWDTETSGQTTSAGGTGKTTAEMKTKSMFTDAGWDFMTIWDIVEGQTYPFFKSEVVTYNLTITATSGGTTAPAPGTYGYSSGSYVDVNAIPDVSYSFDHWELDGSNVGSADPYSVLMNGDHTLRAVFIYVTCELVPIIDTFTTVMESKTTDWDTEIGAPFVIYDAGLYKMWYFAISQPWPCRCVIAYAESNDGITWFNKQVVHDAGFGYYHTGTPWVIREGGTYRMWHSDYYEWVAGDWSYYIAHMTSTNGISWPGFMSAGDQKVLSALGQSNPQGDGYCVFAPCVLYEPGIGYTMWYSVVDHYPPPNMNGHKIWRATSNDGITWSNRQLSLPYVPNTWESDVEHASVVKENDGTYTMFYWAGSSNGSIGITKSADGITWTDRRQWLKPSDLSANITYIREPFHFRDVDGKRYLYFNYYDQGDGKSKFGRIQIGAYPQVTARFVIVDKERVGRTLFRYTCKVTLTNLSPYAVENVKLELVGVPDNMTIIDSNVTFDYIEAGESATSDDTCSFEADRSQAIVLSEIIWQVTYEIADTGQAGQQMSSTMVQLEPISLAGDITGDGAVNLEDMKVLAGQWLQPPGTPSADIAPTPADGIVNFFDYAVFAEHWLEGF
jgi:hypothetical protein